MIDLTGPRLLGASRLTTRNAQYAADLKQVTLKCVDKAFSLPMFAGDADVDTFVLDDITYAKTISRCRAEAELSQ
ncbi:hypothetical protein RRF57_005028 [Xylaria bambusicola]|uniref:Uncharacterized protein n=1 Tax=Xylaria bambusicola TaxID=326684 RepID=A0AAN7UL84_9PEZI